MGKQARLKKQRGQARQAADLDLSMFLDLYRSVAPAIMYTEFTDVRCCLNATRVFIDVARAYGVTATSHTVRMMAMNAMQWKLLQEQGKPTNAAQAQEWADLGAYLAMCDGKGVIQGDGWSGHLIAIAGDVMVDSSARQFSRPQHNMAIPDIVLVDINRAFKVGAEPVVFEVPSGAIMTYEVLPTHNGYFDLPGFQPHEGNIDVARRVILALDNKLPKEWQARSRPKVRSA